MNKEEKTYKMEMSYVPQINKWLCQIKGTGQAYMVTGEKNAKKLVSEVNRDIKNGKLYFEGGVLRIKEGVKLNTAD